MEQGPEKSGCFCDLLRWSVGRHGLLRFRCTHSRQPRSIRQSAVVLIAFWGESVDCGNGVLAGAIHPKRMAQCRARGKDNLLRVGSSDVGFSCVNGAGKSPFGPRFPLLLGRRPSGPRLPGAEPPGSAGSTCAHHLRGLPEPPVFFRPKDRGLRQITLGRILTERCEPHSSQDEQGKSQMALHLNEPTTMDSTVAHADGQSFLGPVVITAHLRD